MKIYTRTGDKGETGLFGGGRVAKDDPRLAAYGSVDELNAWIGWLRAVGLEADLDVSLQQVQNRLFDLGADLASPDASKLEGRSQPVQADDVTALEGLIDGWEEELSSLKQFVLPGGCEAAARAHVVRTMCRRAEREVVTLQQQDSVSETAIHYLNRLSDFLFVLARLLNKRAGVGDVFWEK